MKTSCCVEIFATTWGMVTLRWGERNHSSLCWQISSLKLSESVTVVTWIRRLTMAAVISLGVLYQTARMEQVIAFIQFNFMIPKENSGGIPWISKYSMHRINNNNNKKKTQIIEAHLWTVTSGWIVIYHLIYVLIVLRQPHDQVSMAARSCMIHT